MRRRRGKREGGGREGDGGGRRGREEREGEVEGERRIREGRTIRYVG